MSDDTSKLPWAPVADLPIEGHFPSLEGASGWLNSGPLTPAGLRGRIVAVDFCTYTCIRHPALRITTTLIRWMMLETVALLRGVDDRVHRSLTRADHGPVGNLTDEFSMRLRTF